VARVWQRDVFEATDVTNIIATAMARRCTKSTRVNADSSRSHCVFSLKIEGSHARKGHERKGCLHLVDLAGSERLSKSGSSEKVDLLKEAQVLSMAANGAHQMTWWGIQTVCSNSG
jgi:kinesin family member C1